jgi:hypothetical protein
MASTPLEKMLCDDALLNGPCLCGPIWPRVKPLLWSYWRRFQEGTGALVAFHLGGWYG